MQSIYPYLHLTNLVGRHGENLVAVLRIDVHIDGFQPLQKKWRKKLCFENIVQTGKQCYENIFQTKTKKQCHGKIVQMDK